MVKSSIPPFRIRNDSFADQTISTTVVIVNWNGRRWISDCLAGLSRQTYQGFKTIVVDNASKDGSIAWIKKHYPEVCIIALDRNEGFAVANNIAISQARTKYVALINNDAVAHSQWLEKLIKCMESTPTAGLAASKILYKNNQMIIDRAGDGYTTAGAGYLRGRGRSAEEYNHKETIFGACAGAAIYRRSMLVEIGGFDEDFFLLYEDVDLSFRAQLQGYRCLYEPDSIAYHTPSSSIGHDSPTSVYYGHRNLEWVFLKNMPARLIIRTVFLHLIYDLTALLFFTLTGKGIIYLKAKRDALKGFGKMLRKRREIQKGRQVSDHYIWSLFSRENLIDRLILRSDRKMQAQTNRELRQYS
jgi:GT2 family glycosyltransferase